MPDENNMITVSCDLCGSDQQELVFVKEGFRHVRCRVCGLVFVNPRLADHLDLQRNSGTGCMGEERLTQAQRRRLQRELQGLEPFRRLNRVLEVGAGRGWFLGEASAAGWETWALEVNDSAVQRLQERGVDRIRKRPAEDPDLPEEHFDVVRMWDVIEHFLSPTRALEHVCRALRPGGLLRLSTTNFHSLSFKVNGPEWVYINGADHIVLFTPETITRLLAETGFSSIKVTTRSFNLRRKLYHPEKTLPPGSRVLVPFRKIIDSLVCLTSYGHQMIVTAVKPGG